MTFQPIRPCVTFVAIDYQLSSKTSDILQPLAEAFTRLGWQVDIYCCLQSEDNVFMPEWIAPHCRLIRLKVNEQLSVDQQIVQFAQTLQAFQIKDGTISTLVHTFGAGSIAVGHYLQQHSGWRWIHSDLPSNGHPNISSDFSLVDQADQRIDFSYQNNSSKIAAAFYKGISPAEARNQLDLPKSGPIIVYDTRDQSPSDFSKLVAALSCCGEQSLDSTSCCVIVPDGEENQFKRCLPKSFSSELTNWVWIPASRAVLAYQAADLGIITSLLMPWATLALRALDADLYVIAPDVAAHQFTLVPGVTGQLAKDDETFASAIIQGIHRRYEQRHPSDIVSKTWMRIAAHLSDCYRKHLAQQMGAKNVAISSTSHFWIPASEFFGGTVIPTHSSSQTSEPCAYSA